MSVLCVYECFVLRENSTSSDVLGYVDHARIEERFSTSSFSHVLSLLLKSSNYYICFFFKAKCLPPKNDIGCRKDLVGTMYVLRGVIERSHQHAHTHTHTRQQKKVCNIKIVSIII
jgi:hypothetical protein